MIPQEQFPFSFTIKGLCIGDQVSSIEFRVVNSEPIFTTYFEYVQSVEEWGSGYKIYTNAHTYNVLDDFCLPIVINHNSVLTWAQLVDSKYFPTQYKQRCKELKLEHLIGLHA